MMSVNEWDELEPGPSDDAEGDLMDAEGWDWDDPVEVHVVGKPGAVLRVWFTRDEFLALERIARESGLEPISFSHRTIVEAIAAHQDSPK
jgi:hypothetical protein